ncbi:MAG: PD40 domain-containing protein [Planctomycetes bacterium]|nr:PD40 domain-containing protein [Planctomycetota bacterium]
MVLRYAGISSVILALGARALEAAQESSFEEKLLATLPEGVDDVYSVHPVFSPDGRSVCYGIEQSKRWYVVFEGKKSEPFDDVSDLQYALGGKAIAYRASKGGRAFAACGDSRSKDFATIERLVLHPNGKTFAFQAYEKEGDRRKGFVVVEDKKGESFDFVSGLRFSPDGAAVAYLGIKDYGPNYKLYYVVTGDKKYGDYKEAYPPVFSPDGKRVAYAALDGWGSWRIFVDGESNAGAGLFQNAIGPTFSADGKVMAYAGLEGDGWHVHVGEKKGEAYAGVDWPVLNRDGSLVAYGITTRSYNQHMVVGERKGREFKSVWGPTFDPGGTKVAYVAGKEARGGSYVVLGDRLEGPFDNVGELVFRADGKKLAFGARKGRELWWKVMDVEK